MQCSVLQQGLHLPCKRLKSDTACVALGCIGSRPPRQHQGAVLRSIKDGVHLAGCRAQAAQRRANSDADAHESRLGQAALRHSALRTWRS